MEESIKQYSSTIEIKERKKPPVKKILIALLCIIVIFLVSYKIVLHILWQDYYDKYYLAFLERNNIANGAEDNASSWGYEKYITDDFRGIIEYHVPNKDKFTFVAGLAANSGDPDETYWTIPSDDTVHYRPYLSASVKWNGKIRYYGTLDFCYGGTENQFDYCDFYITDEDTFVFDAKGFGAGNADNSDKVLYFKDEFLELKKTLDSEILGI